jgi:hypothetical protein
MDGCRGGGDLDQIRDCRVEPGTRAYSADFVQIMVFVPLPLG